MGTAALQLEKMWHTGLGIVGQAQVWGPLRMGHVCQSVKWIWDVGHTTHRAPCPRCSLQDANQNSGKSPKPHSLPVCLESIGHSESWNYFHVWTSCGQSTQNALSDIVALAVLWPMLSTTSFLNTCRYYFLDSVYTSRDSVGPPLGGCMNGKVSHRIGAAPPSWQQLPVWLSLSPSGSRHRSPRIHCLHFCPFMPLNLAAGALWIVWCLTTQKWGRPDILKSC